MIEQTPANDAAPEEEQPRLELRQRSLSVGLGWMGRLVGDSQDAPVGESRPRMERAKELALSDSRVRRLLGSLTRVVQAPGPWTGCGGRPIGAVLSVELSRSISIDQDLPFVSFEPVQKSQAYAEGVVHLAADGITSLEIGVDLARRQVISIDPSGDHVHLRDDRIVRPLEPAGLPAPGGCPPSKSD